jgi:type I restriction enzyme M protein
VEKFSRVVSQEEIRANEYNLNIPRYVDSSEAAETWDIYASMFGGIPKSEIAEFDDYWQTFDGLKEVLFTNGDSPYSGLATDDVAAAISENTAVIAWKNRYEEAFGDFAALLKGELIDGWQDLNISKEESVIANAIFSRLEQVSLVDRYSAYQALDDEWAKTAVDLEILQTEGFAATKKVNPFLVLKKKDGKDQEVQDGWVGHVIPFDLIQATVLKGEAKALKQNEERLAEIQAAYDEIIDSLSEEDKDSDVLNEAKDAFVAAEVGKKIKELFGSAAKAKTAALAYDEDSFERKIAQVGELIDEEKALKKKVKDDAATLHLAIKAAIEKLTDEQATELLEEKWISPLLAALHKIPDNIISDLITRVRALADKYATTYAEVAGQIAETKSSLSSLIDGLTGNEYDMKGLGEFQSLLRGDTNA